MKKEALNWKFADFVVLEKNPITVAVEEMQNIEISGTYLEAELVFGMD